MAECPQPLKLCLLARFMSEVRGKPQTALTSGQALPEVMELNWGENCFFPSHWTESKARRELLSVSVAEKEVKEGKGEGREYLLASMHKLLV